MGSTLSSKARAPSIQETYSFETVIGQGTYAQVRLCLKRDADTSRAVKIVECGSKRARAEVRHEGMLWKRATGHSHVVKLLETYEDENCGYFVMERCAHSVFDVLPYKKDQVEEAHLLMTFRDMLLGLQHCHSVKVMHRDVKPANFLVSFDGVVKLCDFGLARLETAHGISGRAGTAPFMSPEMVQGHRYNHKTDIWSLGASFYLMLYGEYPYQIRRSDLYHGTGFERELMHHAIATDFPKPTYVEEKGLRKPSLPAQEFVQALLERDPCERPSSGQCFSMSAMLTAYMKSVDVKQQQKGTGLWGLQKTWTLTADEKEGTEVTWSADQIDGSQTISSHASEMRGAIEAIDQLPMRLYAKSEDPADSKVNCSKDHTGSKSSYDTVSTADTSHWSMLSRGQVSTNSPNESLESPLTRDESEAGCLKLGRISL